MFADDFLLFCRATIGEAEVINEILRTYANASGQCINMEKSSVFFSSNTQASHRAEIVSVLEVKKVERFETYLGLPTLVGRAKYQTFSYLKGVFGRNCKVGKDACCQKLEKKFLLRLLLKLSRLIPWVCSSCL